MYISRARLALHSIETIFALFTIFDNSTDFDFLVISEPSDVWSRVPSNIAAKRAYCLFVMVTLELMRTVGLTSSEIKHKRKYYLLIVVLDFITDHEEVQFLILSRTYFIVSRNQALRACLPDLHLVYRFE